MLSSYQTVRVSGLGFRVPGTLWRLGGVDAACHAGSRLAADAGSHALLHAAAQLRCGWGGRYRERLVEDARTRKW
jgi:hypothetical protein